MNLTKGQRKYIKKNRNYRSAAEIAIKLHISEDIVISFLEQQDNQAKKTGKVNNSLLAFNLFQWIKHNWGLLLLLSVVVIIVYTNALENGFVSDDRGILINAQSWTLESVIFRFNSVIRDVLYLFTFKIGGFNTFLFRLPNIFFHIGVVWLIFLILSLLTNRFIAVLSAFLFVVHPILVESVTWISGGIYVQFSFFFLLDFFLYMVSVKNKKVYICSVIMFGVALLNSEKVIPLCGVFFLYELSFGNIQRNWKKVIPFFVLSGFWALYYLSRLGPKLENLQASTGQNQTFYNPIQQIPIAITSYFELIFWPDALTLYHSELTFSEFSYGIRAIVFLIFLGFIFFCYKKNKLLFFWLSFFIIALSPTLLPVGVAWVVAERYVYLGSLGIFVAIAWVFSRIWMVKKLRSICIILLACILFSLSLRTIIRNTDWKDEDALWLSAARTSPSSSQNHNNLGDYYGRRGDLQNSIKEFQKAIELNPKYADAYHNLGNAYRDAGKPDEAIQAYKKAIFYNKLLWQSYQNIATIFFLKQDYKSAKSYIEDGLKVDSKNSNLLTTLGLIYYKTGDIEMAKTLLIESVKIDPTNPFTKQIIDQVQNGGVVK